MVIDFVCAVIRGCQHTPVCESGGFGGKNIRIHKIDELLEGINTANAAGRRLIGDRTRIWCVRQTKQFLNMGGFVDVSADIMPEIKWRVRLAWACYNRVKRKLYDM